MDGKGLIIPRNLGKIIIYTRKIKKNPQGKEVKTLGEKWRLMSQR